MGAFLSTSFDEASQRCLMPKIHPRCLRIEMVKQILQVFFLDDACLMHGTSGNVLLQQKSVYILRKYGPSLVSVFGVFTSIGEFLSIGFRDCFLYNFTYL